ncbi:MAG TPA: hypothetical protein DIS95_10635 [Proteus vulgaris]|nr:hypothetical protein EGX81_10850 [Proteus vulgaris]RNT29412.1 hypothetical protein B9475_004535 [Proteus mirabilis]HCN42841.1 hypothetical protein [Proteus vulgaris]
MITVYLYLSSFLENFATNHSVFHRDLTNLTLVFNIQLLANAKTCQSTYKFSANTLSLTDNSILLHQYLRKNLTQYRQMCLIFLIKLTK